MVAQGDKIENHNLIDQILQYWCWDQRCKLIFKKKLYYFVTLKVTHTRSTSAIVSVMLSTFFLIIIICFYPVAIKSMNLKDKFTHKWKFSHCLLQPMLMESLVRFCIPPNISGALQQKQHCTMRAKTLSLAATVKILD